MTGTISTRDADYAYDIVKKICNEVGPGLPGSPLELAQADINRKEQESQLRTDNVEATLVGNTYKN